MIYRIIFLALLVVIGFTSLFTGRALRKLYIDTPIITITPTNTVTSTSTQTATPTNTATPTITPTGEPSDFPPPTFTFTPTQTPTSTPTFTLTPTPTETATPVPTNTPIPPTDTPTPTPTIPTKHPALTLLNPDDQATPFAASDTITLSWTPVQLAENEYYFVDATFTNQACDQQWLYWKWTKEPHHVIDGWLNDTMCRSERAIVWTVYVAVPDNMGLSTSDGELRGEKALTRTLVWESPSGEGNTSNPSSGGGGTTTGGGNVPRPD